MYIKGILTGMLLRKVRINYADERQYGEKPLVSYKVTEHQFDGGAKKKKKKKQLFLEGSWASFCPSPDREA